MHFSTLFNQKVDPPRVELGSQEPESHMLPLHHGSVYNKRRGKYEINKQSIPKYQTIKWIKQKPIYSILLDSVLPFLYFTYCVNLISHILCFSFLRVIKKGTTGIEPVTTGTAVLCSTTELSALNDIVEINF